MLLDRVSSGQTGQGIEALKWMEAKAVAQIISGEHPQVAAIVLAHLEPEQSASVLPLLSEEKRTDPRQFVPIVFDNTRLQRAIGDERRKQGEIGAKALGGLAGKVMEALDAGILVIEEVTEVDRRRLARRVAVHHDRAAVIDFLERCRER